MSEWYQFEKDSQPKARFVFDLAIGEGMWDRSVDLGACDLVWCPGWVLRDGWPGEGWSSWPDPVTYHRIQEWSSRLPAHLQRQR